MEQSKTSFRKRSSKAKRGRLKKDAVELEKLEASPNKVLCLKKANYYVPNSKDMTYDEKETCVHDISSLKVINTTKGVQLVDPQVSVPVFTLIPREHVLQFRSPAMFQKINNVLKYIVNKGKKNNRGSKRAGITKKEVSVGVAASRNSHGYVYSPMMRDNPLMWSALKKFARQTEHPLKRFIPENILKGLYKAKDFIGWTTLEDNSMFSALAASCNYYSKVHTDEDFFLSVLQVFAAADTYKSHCEVDAPVVNHFCFPTYGFAVAIRPGDCLLFNPTVAHCQAKKETIFEHTDVYSTSFYLKSKVVGLNDNRIPLKNNLK